MSRYAVLFLALSACQSGAAVGTTCARNSDCASPLACSFGRCRTECVAQRDCPLGATCLLDQNGIGSCSLLDDPACTSASCDAPLACINGGCVNLCAEITECPMGSDCVPTDDHRARCVRTDGEDAGLSDAGVDAPMQSVDAAPSIDTNTDAGLCTPNATGHAPCQVALEVVVADEHSCVRSALPHSDDGHVWCWGEGATLGRDGDTSGCGAAGCPHPAQVRFEDTTGVVDANDVERVLLSNLGGCYTTHTTGRMVCWGTQDYAAPLGSGVTDGARARVVLASSTTPFEGTSTFTVFGQSAIAADQTGQWFGWGVNDGNVLNRAGASLDQIAPLGMGWVDIRSVAAGGTHGCGTPPDGGVACWGSNAQGQSWPEAFDAGVDGGGVDAAIVHAPVGPTQLTMTAGVVTGLAAGTTHSCMLMSGRIYCWGLGELMPGGNPCGMAVCPPTPLNTGTHHIASLTPVSDADDLCFVDADDGMLYCWGQGYGVFSTSMPTAIPNLPATSVAWLTWSHGCAIDTNARTWCWGNNDRGQLGIGTIDGEMHDATLVVWP